MSPVLAIAMDSGKSGGAKATTEVTGDGPSARATSLKSTVVTTTADAISVRSMQLRADITCSFQSAARVVLYTNGGFVTAAAQRPADALTTFLCRAVPARRPWNLVRPNAKCSRSVRAWHRLSRKIEIATDRRPSAGRAAT